ncbi:ABC transporter permease [Spiractinospora alimapuensis]|uniref:ABC transporter permease n=1 Tax=Spiractinospora alimapuensis TaxID=2820884 RepID=UPI001F1EADCF|nr:ABC transporter permease [Spiractinospora alimapuensis]QVQ53033.1 ABC transporter permease [Spiractinospora alimapuensis]
MTDRPTQDPAAPAPPATRPTRPRRTLAGYLFMPLLLLAVLLALAWWVQRRPLDSIESRVLTVANIAQRTGEHVSLTVVSTLLVLVIAVPLGIVLTRRWARPITPFTVAVFNIGVAVPSIGFVALFALIWDIGFWPAVAALVAYAALPVLRNTMVGLRQVDPTVIESARGMGMGSGLVLLRIELPLAVPVILAGIRTALVINVGSAAVATFIGAGGLGSLIVTGSVQVRPLITLVGAVLTAVLALLIDYLAGLAEDRLRPRGLSDNSEE